MDWSGVDWPWAIGSWLFIVGGVIIYVVVQKYRRRKPKTGDLIRIVNPVVLADGLHGTYEVGYVFDNLDEDWSPFGESAMGMADYEQETGQKGDWYVLIFPDTGESMPLASYEVEVVR